jgi:hypothetical protein
VGKWKEARGWDPHAIGGKKGGEGSALFRGGTVLRKFHQTVQQSMGH